MAATHRVSVHAPLQAILGCTTTTRTAAVRGLWAYIREHDLKRGRYIALDAKLRPLAAALQPKTLKNGEPLLRRGQCHFLGIASLIARHVGTAAPAPAPADDTLSVVPSAPHIL